MIARAPVPLPEGGHVRVISPASPALLFAPERAARAARALTDLGFTLSYGAFAREYAKDPSGDTTSAGTAEQRADDLMTAYSDPDVDAILVAAGGETSRDVLEHLDAAVFEANPKPFIGHCDSAWINQFLLSEAGLTSFYGVTFMADFGEVGGPFPETVEAFRRAVMTAGDLAYQPVPSRTNELRSWLRPKEDAKVRDRNVPGGWRWLRDGAGSGRTVCVELSMLPQVTRHFSLRLDGLVLVWDITPEAEEPATDTIARVASEVDLSRVAGMVIGPDVRYSADEWADTVWTALDTAGAAGAGPVVVNADVGHLSPTWVVPYGGVLVLASECDVVSHRAGPTAELHRRRRAEDQ